MLEASWSAYLEETVGKLSNYNCSIVAVTHLLPDRVMFLPALQRVGKLAAVLCVPYSMDWTSVEILRDRFNLLFPTLNELRSASFLENIIRCVPTSDVLVFDIGGYFSFLHDGTLGEKRIVGVVEDTEAGHRAHEAKVVGVPTFSVARSPLKLGEDMLVGASTAYSLERMRREGGSILDAKCCLVLGFGKVGKGMAVALRARHARVIVYDSDPARRIEALAWGFAVPERVDALRSADYIVGATGFRSLQYSDLEYVRSGAVLLSTSSKDVEFPVSEIRANGTVVRTESDVESFAIGEKTVSLLYRGEPLNFRDRAVMGPFLALTQAEILACGVELISEDRPPGIYELGRERRNQLAASWISTFIGSGGAFCF